MALAWAVQGATKRAQNITWTTETGVAVDLTGAVLTGTIKPESGTKRAIAGALALVTPTSGIFSWTYHSTDVSTAGVHAVQFVATYGSTPDRTKEEEWIVYRNIDA